ncbi:MAG: hypothetical protein CMN76_12460 [Spirochaetaceae bacterium]|nr:hypothetical protein [Spirochaetaceae bacterium]|tara:strand:- start:59172 stop:61439 length:2268 start_codon:yes stop_codon:yes gene_type:complete
MNSPIYIDASDRVGNWALNLQASELQFNANAAKILGRPELRKVGVEEFFQFVHPDDRARVQSSLLSSGAGHSCNLHFRILHPDGTVRILEKIGSIADQEIQGILRDVTLRESQLQKLMRENQELAEAQSLALMGRWELDLVRNHLHWSSGIFEMFEIDPERFPASYEAFLNAIHPEDRGRVDKAYTDSLKNRQPYEIEHRLLFPDGRIKWVREKCKTAFDSQGKALRSTGIVQDITSQKLGELQLRKMETFLERTSEVAGIGGWEVDLTTGILFWSDVTRRIHDVPDGYQPNVHNAIQFYADEASRKAIREAVERAMSAGQSFCLELPIKTWKGKYKWIEARGEGELFDDKVQRVFGTVQEITSRKEEEARQKEEHRRALDHNQAKTRFLSNLSHELRTPLNAMLGYAQLLNGPGENLGPTQAHRIAEILKAGDYIQGLLADVLDLSRVESRELDLNISTIDGKSLIEQCIRLTGPLAQKKGIRVNFEPPGKDHAIDADPLRSQQCVINILSNAIKYNRTDGSVEVRIENTGTGNVRISISDTGPGIPEEKQTKLFEPFQRLGMESSGIEGTGLGLALTKELLELMGGGLRFHSASGKGSTFCLYFREGEAASPLSDLDLKPQEGKDLNAIHGKVLYIEDNPINMRLMEQIILSTPGVELLKANTGEEGLRMARENDVDLFLIDLRLPDLTGFEIIQTIRSWRDASVKPAICISADAMESEISNARNAGFDDYLTKPLDIADLQRKLAHYLHADP